MIETCPFSVFSYTFCEDYFSSQCTAHVEVGKLSALLVERSRTLYTNVDVLTPSPLVFSFAVQVVSYRIQIVHGAQFAL
jgi:hypothetical protein